MKKSEKIEAGHLAGQKAAAHLTDADVRLFAPGTPHHRRTQGESKVKPPDGRYGQNALGRGHIEDKTLCVEEVWNGPRGMTSSQCSRKRGHGLNGEWCKQHAKRHPAEVQQ